MKHKILDKKKVSLHEWNFTIELTPENETERNAILHTETTTATEEERSLIDNYLAWCAGQTFTVVRLIRQKKNIFVVRFFQN